MLKHYLSIYPSIGLFTYEWWCRISSSFLLLSHSTDRQILCSTLIITMMMMIFINIIIVLFSAYNKYQIISLYSVIVTHAVRWFTLLSPVVVDVIPWDVCTFSLFCSLFEPMKSWTWSTVHTMSVCRLVSFLFYTP